LFFLFLLSLASSSAHADAITLREAIDRAMISNLEVRSQRKQEKQADADVSRVAGEFGLRVEGLLGVGPITKATGNALTAVEDKSTIGKIIIGKLTLTKPVFSWGRKGDYEDAARSGVQVKIAESQLKEAEVRYEVKEVYYGYQLANSFRDFIEGGKSELKKALEARGKKKKDS
jgi:outer membrane protein TolC